MLLTYAELAERLGVAPEAARSVARRRHWPIIQGNDGRARVTVEESDLAAAATLRYRDRSVDQPAGRPDDHAVDQPVAELRDRVATTEAEVARLVGELAVARERAIRAEARVEALTELREAEARGARETTDALRAARDDLAARLDRAESELRRARLPWWRRLAGG